MNTAFVFPGQGSQAVAMGKDLYNNFPVARKVFKEVDVALKQNLSQIIFDGPIEDLTLTQNTQPALMATSAAFLSVILAESGKNIEDICHMTAGHSVGEYAAHIAAGTMNVSDAAQILRIRGEAMLASCPKGEGAMAACLGLNIQQVENIINNVKDKGICDIANDNSESQIVISGNLAAIDMAVPLIKEAGGKAIKLNVSGPFHSKLMINATKILAEKMDSFSFITPTIPVVLNVTAQQSTDITEIRKSLIEQVSGRVRWRETISYFAGQNISKIVEIGPGKVLNNMLKKSDHHFDLVNVGNIAELEDFLKEIA